MQFVEQGTDVLVEPHILDFLSAMERFVNGLRERTASSLDMSKPYLQRPYKESVHFLITTLSLLSVGLLTAYGTALTEMLYGCYLMEKKGADYSRFMIPAKAMKNEMISMIVKGNKVSLI